MPNYKLKSVKTKSFKGNRLKKIAYALKGYFPHNYIESSRIILRHPKRRDWKAWVHLRQESYSFLQKWEPYWNLNQCNKSNYMKQLKLQRNINSFQEYYPNTNNPSNFHEDNLMENFYFLILKNIGMALEEL